MRRASRAACALAVATGLAVAAGCGGGGGDDAATTAPASAPSTAASAPAPAGPSSVRVVDGDTGRPAGGATVTGLDGSLDPVGTVTADGDGVARAPEGSLFVRATSGRSTGTSRVAPSGELRLRIYDPRLQSPEYGGGPARTRFVPAVDVPPPSGKPSWTFDARTLIEFPPAVVDGLVVFGVNSGRVFALDADTGEVRWARRQKGEIAATPAISGGKVVVASMDGMLTAYSRGSGAPLWQYSTDGSPIESSPLVVGGLVYTGAWNGRLSAVDLDTGRLRWSFSAAGDIKGSPARSGANIIVGDYAGNVYALDARTGAERWRFTGGQRFYGGPGVSGDTIVIGDVGGAVIALDARTGAERWRHSTGGDYVYASPAIARGTVFIGSYAGDFQALDLATGASRWSFDVGGRISGSATVVGDVVYVSRLYSEGQARATYGLDTATGAVVYQTDDGRYSPAVAAGRTLYLVGTRMLRAYHAERP